MAKKRVLRRKPISFDTTLRNPRRIPQFISILKPFEGKILDDFVALELESEIICQKIYIPTESTLGKYVSRYDKKFSFVAEDQSDNAKDTVRLYYKEWEESSPSEFSRDKMIYLLRNTITSHKEAGWHGGWESRLHTQYNFLNELGFVRVVKGERILISENGNLMIKEYENGHPKNENYDSSFEESAFLNAFAKYQTNNPYRSNTIKVNFFPLVLNTIKAIKEIHGRSGLALDDLPFVISWDSNDFEGLARLIHNFRNKFGYNTSSEQVYDYSMNSLDEDTPNELLQKARNEFINNKQKDYKFDKITRETPDEIVRKMRLTMLVSLKGAGRFIDLNKLEQKKIDWVSKKYSTNKDFSDDYIKYFEYMGKVDIELNFIAEEFETDEALSAKDQAIVEWALRSDWNFLKSEMLSSVNKTQSQDPILRYINETVRLEFLAAITLKKALPSATIIANYKADDQGIPFSVAMGSKNGLVGTDIDVIENDVHAIIEPTISKSRSFQTEHELPSIRNHVLESKKYDDKNRTYIKTLFALLIASNISRDVGDQVALIKYINNVEIFPWDIEDFVDFSKDVKSILDYRIIRHYVVPQTI
jgi:hypothetical protein